MKPFSAWLAMNFAGGPMTYGVKIGLYTGTRIEAFLMPGIAKQDAAERKDRGAGMGDPQRVLIIEDTDENRRKLGMEGS